MKFTDYCWRDRVIALLITSYDFSACMLISYNRERCREKDFGWHIKVPVNVVAENAPVAAPAAEEAPVEAPAEAAAEEEAPAAE